MKRTFLYTLALLLVFSCCYGDYVYNSVNVITGEYAELETDLNIRRSYSSINPLGWKFDQPVIRKDNIALPEGLTFTYGENSTEVRGLDGRWVRYDFHITDSRNGKVHYLDKIGDSTGKEIIYHYRPHPMERSLLISKREETDGRYLINEYYERGGPNAGKVKLQKAPAGADEAPVTVFQYYYYPGYTEVLDALGNKTIYRYEQEKLTAIENYGKGGSFYRAERFSWNDAGLMASRWIEDATGIVWRKETFTYDLHGNVAQHTFHGDLSGSNANESYTTLYRWSDDEKHILLLQSGDNGQSVRYVYHDGDEKLAEKLIYDGYQLKIHQLYCYNEEGNVVRTDIYDGEGNFCESLHAEKGIEGNTVEKRYDKHGNLIYFNEKGNETDYVYDYSNRLIRKEERGKHAPVKITTFRYDVAGNLTAAVDKFGNEIEQEYDDFHRLVLTTLPAIGNSSGEVIRPTASYIYDILNRVISSTDLNGYETKTEYNIRGKPTNIRHPDGTVEKFAYNLDGSLKEVFAKTGTRTLYTRDYLSRIVREEVYSPEGTLLQWMSREYAAYQLVGESDHTGNTVRYNYDEPPAKTVTAEKSEPRKPSCDYSDIYNELGQNVLVKYEITPQGLTLITTCDALGRARIIEKKLLDQTISKKKIDYDAAGNKIAEIHHIKESAPYICRWGYGPGNRLEWAVEGPEQRKTEYFYNAQGLLETTLKSDGISLHVCYSPLGKLERQYSSDGTIDYHYTYDEQGRLISVADHVNGTETRRNYDPANKKFEEFLGNGLSIGYGYDQSGKRTELRLHDGSKITYTYDAAHLRSIKRFSNLGECIYEHQYNDYSPSGKILQSRLIGAAGTLTFSYDKENRLASIESPFFKQHYTRNSSGRIESISGTFSQEFSYDSLGQLTHAAEESFTYDSIYRRNENDGAEYRHDSNGNLIEEKSDQVIRYTYDALNRLIRVAMEDGYTANYTYDFSGRRLSSFDSNGIHTRFLYDGQNEIGSVDATGAFRELRVLGIGIGAELGAAVSIEIDGSVYAPLHDHRGSITCLIDAQTGVPAAWYNYSAFGISMESHETEVLNPWKFAGKREDATGLIYFGKRYYHPKSGRWITGDPMGHPESINRHAYALNDPINRVDPLGLFSFSELFESFWSGLKSAYDYVTDGVGTLRTHLSFSHYIQPEVQKIGEAILGSSLLNLAGYYNDHSQMGVHGNGEVNDKVRITLINGILNARFHYKDTIKTVSEAHGGVNIHYVLNATDGWTWDLLRGIAAKAGWTSSEAHMLAETWKSLIEEMGGAGEGGLIIHYAHSIGGTHTNLALRLLSPEERKMIRIYTFGSPTTITNCGAESSMNFICALDGISLLDPVGYFSGLFELNDEVAIVGSWLGIPLMDHPLSGTYLDIIKILGAHFQQQYN